MLDALGTVDKSQMLPEVRSEMITVYEVGEPLIFPYIAAIICCKKENGEHYTNIGANSCSELTVLLINAISTVKFLVKLSYPQFSSNLGGLGAKLYAYH